MLNIFLGLSKEYGKLPSLFSISFNILLSILVNMSFLVTDSLSSNFSSVKVSAKSNFNIQLPYFKTLLHQVAKYFSALKSFLSRFSNLAAKPSDNFIATGSSSTVSTSTVNISPERGSFCRASSVHISKAAEITES